MKKLPNWAKSGRGLWEYYGQKRPSFALSPKKDEESVWDYPRPPQIQQDSRTVVVKVGDVLIAESNSAVRILETASPPTFYLPPSDINFNVLQSVNRSSNCEWKGTAQYWNFVAQETLCSFCGWSYSNPFEEFISIKDYLSFYPAKLECYVDGERVKPQPGGFYGGWITKEIVGPVKGEDPRAYL